MISKYITTFSILLTRHSANGKEHTKSIKLIVRHLREVVQDEVKYFLLLALLKGIPTIIHTNFKVFKVTLNFKHSNNPFFQQRESKTCQSSFSPYSSYEVQLSKNLRNVFRFQ